MKSVIVNIRIASANEAANPISNIQAGIGRIIIAITAINASASRTVGRKTEDIDRVKLATCEECSELDFLSVDLCGSEVAGHISRKV